MAHIVTVDGDRLRYQMLARPDGIAHRDPAHDQIAAYAAVAGRLSIPGVTYTTNCVNTAPNRAPSGPRTCVATRQASGY